MSRKAKVLAGIAVGALLAGGTAGALALREEDPKRRAYDACTDFVAGNLKAPATARFLGFSNAHVVGEGAGPYTVVAKVDAENSFGALVRDTFSCTTERRDGDWRLTEELIFLNRDAGD